MNGIDLQRAYYAATAGRYDVLHAGETPPIALAVMEAAIFTMNVESVLDVGSGTGNVLLKLPANIRSVGVEPVAALREIGRAKGAEIIDGDGTQLAFPDGAFDLVCAFSALHHIPRASAAVAEMLRVARKAIFICDANNFGQGSLLARSAKQAINALGLWPVANYVKTRGRGYDVSEADGISYSYSVFNDLRQIRKACKRVQLVSLDDSGPNLYRTAGALALLGIKH